MLVANLRCAGDHAFEGWFRSDDDLSRQLAEHAVACPVCGDAQVRRLPSAPAVVSRRPANEALRPQDATAIAMRRLRDYVRGADNVGERFAEEVRRMHYGEAPERLVRGSTSLEQTRELLEEGIAVLPVPDWVDEQ